MATARLKTSPGDGEYKVSIKRDDQAQEEKRTSSQPKNIFKYLWVCLLLLLAGTLTGIAKLVLYLDDLSQKRTCDADSTQIHNEPVTDIMPNASCRFKLTGITSGKICRFGQETYYLKVLPCLHQENTSQLISYEAYNRQFSSKNINVSAPITRFFKDSKNFYIGSKKIENFLEVVPKQIQTKLTTTEIAKLIVAGTFIRDLVSHTGNWGYGKEGLVLIDVDSYHNIPKTTNDYLDLSIESLKNLNFHILSFDVLKEMKQLYTQMQDKILPEFYQDFGQNRETYLEVLNIYIDCCEKTIKKIEQPSQKITSLKFHKPRPYTNREIQGSLRGELVSARALRNTHSLSR